MSTLTIDLHIQMNTQFVQLKSDNTGNFKRPNKR